MGQQTETSGFESTSSSGYSKKNSTPSIARNDTTVLSLSKSRGLQKKSSVKERPIKSLHNHIERSQSPTESLSSVTSNTSHVSYTSSQFGYFGKSTPKKKKIVTGLENLDLSNLEPPPKIPGQENWTEEQKAQFTFYYYNNLLKMNMKTGQST